jgi:hypothetical protein
MGVMYEFGIAGTERLQPVSQALWNVIEIPGTHGLRNLVQT